LRVPVRVIGSFLGFLVARQTVIVGLEEVHDFRMADGCGSVFSTPSPRCADSCWST
jgi:hypothetical protein